MIVLTLPFPPTANTYYRSIGRGRVIISEKGRAYRKRVVASVFEAFDGRPPALCCRLAVCIRVYPPDRKRRDLNNLGKCLLDSLTHAGLWVDDERIDDERWIRCAPCEGGRVVVHVSDFNPEVAK